MQALGEVKDHEKRCFLLFKTCNLGGSMWKRWKCSKCFEYYSRENHFAFTPRYIPFTNTYTCIHGQLVILAFGYHVRVTAF